jgi:sugar/nucleoside kinase (ribokinase family)
VSAVVSPPLVVGLGASSIDDVMLLPAYPQPAGPRSKLRVLGRQTCCGGQTATALVTCARFGLRARFVGPIGSDRNARLVAEELERQGVDLRHLVIREGRNQSAVILVAAGAGERIVLWDRDEDLRAGRAVLTAEALDGAAVLHVDDVDVEAAIAAARLAAGRGIPVTSDIDGVGPLTEALMAAVTLPILAEDVPRALTGLAEADAAIRELGRRLGRAVCVTLGSRGAMAFDPLSDRLWSEPAFPVHVKDTTGAGDVFRGAFIYGLLHAWPMEERLRFATAAAGLACTRLGAIPGIPTLGEVEALLATR